MNKILIINYQRLGDVIQSFPIIYSLRSKKIYYLTSEFNKDAFEVINLKNLEYLKLPLKKIVNLLLSDFSEAFRYLKKFFNKNFDVTINLNFSKLSAIITSLIDSSIKFGPIISEKETLFIGNKFLQKLYFELDECKEKEHILNYYFRALNLTPEEFYIKKNKTLPHSFIFHPGASIEKKKWGIENYIKLADLLKKEFNEIKIFITGSNKEKNENKILEKRLHENKINVKNLTAKLTLKELLNLINQVEWLISSDSMIAHLSALTLTKCVTIFLGGCYHYHTFPYQYNKYVAYPEIKCYPCAVNFECKNFHCRKKISPELIFSIIKEGKNCLKTHKSNSFFYLK